jgi:hypothetical protein
MRCQFGNDPAGIFLRQNGKQCSPYPALVNRLFIGLFIKEKEVLICDGYNNLDVFDMRLDL